MTDWRSIDTAPRDGTGFEIIIALLVVAGLAVSYFFWPGDLICIRKPDSDYKMGPNLPGECQPGERGLPIFVRGR